jgi:hypothetical protein
MVFNHFQFVSKGIHRGRFGVIVPKRMNKLIEGWVIGPHVKKSKYFGIGFYDGWTN